MKIEKKIGALIPIRLASERLPNKAIMRICEKPIVCHLLDRVFKSKHVIPENVVVCTTTESTDDKLVEIVESYGASIFRGSTDDIIKRFYEAMKKFGFDYVIQVDGDDITAEPFYMDLTMEKLLSDDTYDIVTCEHLPLGIASKSFSLNAMQKVYERYKTIKNDTGFIYYFTKTGICNHITLQPISDEHIYDKIRLTLDYQEDYEMFAQIFRALYKEGKVFDLEEILKFVKTNPTLVEINDFRNKEYWTRTSEKSELYYINDEKNVIKIGL